MSDIVISVESLGKSYRISHKGGERERYTALRDVIAGAAGAPFRSLRNKLKSKSSTLNSNPSTSTGATGSPSISTRASEPQNSSTEEFWALRDVSFEVKRGEVLGIIGRNGAGKSTLLKILSRITEPTTGRVRIKGRVASLLEVGTGFHPELTGRENIFLNGAILGMHRHEIKAKFEEIVAFAEVEKFLDTPVKRYSSGMYVRLAFAVAAHLDPEILIVDEVLAVGDADFQRKCLGKMQDVARGEGRTVLFVSHNMVSILQLCSHVMCLGGGKILSSGPPSEEITRYYGTRRLANEDGQFRNARRDAKIDGAARLISGGFIGQNGTAVGSLPFATEIVMDLILEVSGQFSTLEIGLGLFDIQGVEIVSTLSSWSGIWRSPSPGRYRVRADYGVLNLVPGCYRFGIGLRSERGLEDYIPEAIELEVIPSAEGAWENITTVRGFIAAKTIFQMERCAD